MSYYTGMKRQTAHARPDCGQLQRRSAGSLHQEQREVEEVSAEAYDRMWPSLGPDAVARVDFAVPGSR